MFKKLINWLRVKYFGIKAVEIKNVLLITSKTPFQKYPISVLADKDGVILSKPYSKIFHDGENFIADNKILLNNKGEEIFEVKNDTESILISKYFDHTITLDFFGEYRVYKSGEIINNYKGGFEFLLDLKSPYQVFVDTNTNKYTYKNVFKNDQVYAEDIEDLLERIENIKNKKTPEELGILFSSQGVYEYLT